MSRGRRAHRSEERAEYDAQLRAAVRIVALFFGIGLFVVLGVFGGVRIYSLVVQETGPPRAVIVDQLSLTVPNEDFVEAATITMERAGYVVDYIPGEEVTVEFYRDLPTREYDLIVLRVHSARYQDVGESGRTDLAELFTSEPYSKTKYLDEQKLGRLGGVAYEEGGEAYFGIGPAFVTDGMRGEFEDTTVIMMGCNGLTTPVTADAFVRKGAETFISWSDLVTADHTDAATARVLEHLLDDDLPVQDAVAQTMAEVGPDPFYESELLYFPREE